MWSRRLQQWKMEQKETGSSAQTDKKEGEPAVKRHKE